MEIMGTNFTITLGSWRFRLCFAIEDVDAPEAAMAAPHHVRVVNNETYSRREA
jgi:hypothetical protein